MAKQHASLLLLAMLCAASAAPPAKPAEPAEAPEIEIYAFTPEEAPGSPVSVCLNKLTYDCANQINSAIIGKVLNVTTPCCVSAISIGKTCWAYIMNEPMDDPCHFFHYVIAYCLKLTKTTDEALFNFHNDHKPCMGNEAFEALNLRDEINGDLAGDEKLSAQILERLQA